ncbi:cupin domain-containing protein [Paracoccus beibuensis]|uniref:cupin domain-containing protein n=1 Tax=Paracoccus beibuensis TaxID=547602 RepID=UPI0022402A1C|nr:cupin domain-containing protein [Paracoccus beibuensis]
MSDPLRSVLAHSPDLMVVRFDFRTGDQGALHSHPHVQSTFVQSGRYRFTVDGQESEVGPGEAFIIPSGAEHGCLCLEGGVLIDSFTPRRDDFL